MKYLKQKSETSSLQKYSLAKYLVEVEDLTNEMNRNLQKINSDKPEFENELTVVTLEAVYQVNHFLEVKKIQQGDLSLDPSAFYLRAERLELL